MGKEIEVRWEGEFSATPQQVWDAFTVHTAGWLWACRQHMAFYCGRDVWGWPVGVAHHLFADDADQVANEKAWSAWLAGVFATEGVA